MEEPSLFVLHLVDWIGEAFGGYVFSTRYKPFYCFTLMLKLKGDDCKSLPVLF